MDELLHPIEDFPGSFREQVIQSLTVIRSGQVNLIERVTKINGSIKELYARTELNTRDLISHVGACPLKDRVNNIDVLLASHPNSHETAEKFDSFVKSINEKVDGLSKQISEVKTVRVTEKDIKGRVWTALQPLIWVTGTAFLTLILMHASTLLGGGK